MKGELPQPKGSRAPGNGEVLRCWIIDSKLVCVVRPEAWEEVATWGILLADVVRQIGNSIFKQKGILPEKTMTRIYEILKREMKKPTSERTGAVVDTEGETVEESVKEKED